MSGKAIVIIKNGVIDQTAMKNVRMTVLDLIELLRGQEVFDISTVAFAVLEVNGELSILLKSSEQPLTAADMNIKKKGAELSLPVITDGKIMHDSLNALEITEKDIHKKLKASSITVEKVFLMTMDRYKNFNIVKKREES